MTDANEPTALSTRAGFVALIGEPNAGKSTLMNLFVGSKVSIVTHKVQTTRTRIRGVATRGDSQIVFVDTPGLFAPRRRLDRAMVAAAWAGVGDADVVLLLVEAHRGLTDGVKRILDSLGGHIGPKKPVALIINKIDRVPRDELLALAAKLSAIRDFDATFMISALKGHGAEAVLNWLAPRLPFSPWLYPEDQLADLPLRMLASEITREKLMLRLHQELPYQLTVETDKWEERKDGSVRLEQTIYVAREGHRPMLLGKGGETLRQVGQASRLELGEVLERTVHLFLHVKVSPNWLDRAEHYREMGLDFSD